MTFLYPGTGFSLGSSSSSNSNQSPTDPSIVRDARLVAVDRSNNNTKNNKKKSHSKKLSLGDNKIGILQDIGFDVKLATRALESCQVSSLYLKDVDNLDRNVIIVVMKKAKCVVVNDLSKYVKFHLEISFTNCSLPLLTLLFSQFRVTLMVLLLTYHHDDIYCSRIIVYNRRLLYFLYDCSSALSL